MFPGHFDGVVYLSVAVVDSESFKGPDQLSALEERTREHLLRYECYAHSLGLRAASALSIGTEVMREDLAGARSPLHRRAVRRRAADLRARELLDRALHNETAFIVQKRLQHKGIPMIVVPVRIDMKVGRAVRTPQFAARAQPEQEPALSAE
jgi:hypothetical protein